MHAATSPRRLAGLAGALLVACGLLAVPGARPALAYEAALASPADGSDVTDAFDVVVRVAREAGDPAPDTVEVDVRLGDRVVASGPLTCRGLACSGLGGTTTWDGFEVPVADLACNGRLRVDVRVDDAEPLLAGVVVASVRPAALEGLRASRADDGTVTVAWDPTPAQDVRHVVQRRAADGGWQLVGATTGSRLTDEPGDVDDPEYRVVSERGDGRDAGGRPVAACADAEPDLVRESPTVVASGAAPSGPADDADGGTGDGTGPSGDGGSGDVAGDDAATDGGSDGDGEGDGRASGDDGAGQAAPQDGDATGGGSSASSGGSGGAPPPQRDRAQPPSVSVPDGEASAPQEPGTFVPGGDVFEDELDFGGVDPVTGAPVGDRADDSVVVGALRSTIGDRVDLDQLWRFLGIGAALLAAALGLRWWQRRPVGD